MTPSYRPVVTAFQRFISAMKLPWRKTQRENLARLAAAFFTVRSLPVRRLARALVGPSPAVRHCEKRLRRFLGNERLDLDAALAAQLAFLLPRFGHLPFVPVMLDWTYVSTTHAILWAQIPYRGRSFPLLLSVHPYLEQNSTAHATALLERILQAWPKQGPRPLLLADRGFPKQPILKWLGENHWPFVIRARRDTVLHDLEGRPVYPGEVGLGETRCWQQVRVLRLHSIEAHLVVSARLLPGRTGPELTRWLLITDLPEELLHCATHLYAQRMQPEQTHRDCKHGHFVGGFALAHLGRMRADRLERLLFCLGLCYTFTVLLAETDRPARAWFARRHWGLSLTTFGLDLIQWLKTALPQATKRALASVSLEPRWLQSGDS